MTRQPPGNAIEILNEVGPTWVWPHDRPIERPVLLAQVAEASALYCMLTERIDAELLDASPHLRVVSQMAVGVDNIDLAACRERGIAVGHTPDVLTDATADLAFGLIIAAARRFKEGIADVESGAWGDWDPAYLLGQAIHRSTLGIIGLGRIGQAIAQRSSGFSMRVLYTQRNRDPGAEAALGAIYVSLESLLDQSDHVVVAAPLTTATYGLMGTEQFARMKTSATLTNVSRGALIDSEALVEALTNQRIAGAALDVTDPEPIPPDHALVRLPNCLIIPHLGSSTVQTRTAMAELAARNLIAGLAGSRLEASALD